MTTMLMLAALTVVPAPQKAVELGGWTDKTNIVFETDAAIPAEGYRLAVGKDGVKVVSSGAAGRFYALETLKQLADPNGGKGVRYPLVEIEDAPEYKWRGLLLDDCRHFFGKTVVKRLLDEMAMHKMNVFHWHLTEDQGWRIDVPGMPELVKYGATRPKSVKYDTRFWRDANGELQAVYDDERYGPFYYTEAELREIVAYAAERNITVMPEIEVPGHVFCLLAAHPEFACYPENLKERLPRCRWGVEKDVLCVANPEAIRYMERIFDFVCDVFPSKVIDIGGDECPQVRWKTCPKCQAFMKANGMKSEVELQGWVTKHFADYLAKKGRRVLGWTEMLASGDVPKDAMGMLWHCGKGHHGSDYGTEESLTAAGHELVMTPVECCYLDYSQGIEDDPYPYIGGRITLEKCYSLNPRGNVPAERAHMIVGGQGNCWSEYTWNVFDLEWKTWPRACALAEVFWTGAKRPGFDDFMRRMEVHRRRMIKQHVNVAPLR